MKNLILTIVLTISFGSLFASTTPESELTLISNEKVEMNVVKIDQKDFFQTATYNSTMDALDFVTKDYINYIQIFDNNGELQYQLPVMSNKLKISRKMFKSGAYKIAFLTDNNKSIQFTNLTVN